MNANRSSIMPILAAALGGLGTTEGFSTRTRPEADPEMTESERERATQKANSYLQGASRAKPDDESTPAPVKLTRQQRREKELRERRVAQRLGLKYNPEK